MSRYFINTGSIDLGNNSATIIGEDVKHIKNVLRNRVGDILQLSDGNGYDYDVVIEVIDKEAIYTKITNKKENITEPPINITLFQSMPKSGKMEYIIQKCVELGVRKIVPVMTSRTIVKLHDSRDIQAKIIRWNRISLEAAKQCSRGSIPAVSNVVRFNEALELADDCVLKLLPYEKESGGCLKENLKACRLLPDFHYKKPDVAVFIGPEGGFTAEEVKNAADKGFKAITLGPRILRTETAGMAVTSIIMYELGDLSKT